VLYVLFIKKIAGFFTQLSEKKTMEEVSRKKWKSQTAELSKNLSIRACYTVIGLIVKVSRRIIIRLNSRMCTSNEIGEKPRRAPKDLSLTTAIYMII